MMQPVCKDEQGTVRFVSNKIVETLLEKARERGFTLNDLARMQFTQKDWEQFYQLIGYSIRGYHELSMVSDKSAAEATLLAKQIDPKAGGCRDNGDCPIHGGIPVHAIDCDMDENCGCGFEQ